jgi:hypothetical protein
MTAPAGMPISGMLHLLAVRTIENIAHANPILIAGAAKMNSPAAVRDFIK